MARTRTNRSASRNDAIALIAAGNADVQSDTPQVWGSPDIDDDLKLFGNFGYTTAGGAQVYSHTNYASKRVTGGFFFRNPNTRGGVYSLDGGETLLIGDALLAAGMGSANCPTVVVTANVADPVALQQVFDDPNCFSFRERFPGGFTLLAGREDLKETRLRSTARCWGHRRHRQANSVRVCSPASRRVASLRPRSAGLTGLDAGSAHARPDWLLLTMPTPTPPTCCGRRPVQDDTLSSDR